MLESGEKGVENETEITKWQPSRGKMSKNTLHTCKSMAIC